MARKYSNTATDKTLSVSISAAATSITVSDTTGLPATFPYTLVIDPDNSSMEVVNVTAAAGTVLTVARGQDGTTGVTHNLGAAIQHNHTARDFSEPQVHIDATAAHGATGAVMGTTNTQTVSNKTIDSSCTISSSASLPSNVLTETSTDTVTNKTLSTGTKVGGATTDISGAWTSYAPVLSNWAVGNGTLTGRYVQIGKTVHWSIKFTAGGTSTFVGNPNITLPVTMVGTPSAVPVGFAHMIDSSAAPRATRVCWADGTAFRMRSEDGNDLNATTPWTWASGDIIEAGGTYEAV